MFHIKFVARLLLAALCSFGFVPGVAAYSVNGHETVGYLADELIQGTAAETHVKALLGADTLGQVATWADRAKVKPQTDPEMLAFVQANFHHHDYHYTDVPIQKAAYLDGTVGTSSNDIVHVMRECIEVLRAMTPRRRIRTSSRRGWR